LQACELAGRDLLLFLAESAKLESEMTRADFLSTVRRAAPRRWFSACLARPRIRMRAARAFRCFAV
jgi:hypothetical protein